MGFSETKFLKLPPQTRAKKLADLLRVFLLQLGADWKQAKQEYEKLVVWHLGESSAGGYLLQESLQHSRILDLYEHWRQVAGLGAERDMYLQPDPGDRSSPLHPPTQWEVLVHNLRSAYNVGSVIRTSDCFGIQRVHRSGYTPETTQSALRSAARGAESWIPHQSWESPLDCISDAKIRGLSVIALEITPQAIAIQEFQWPKQGLIILGNEELGIAPELLAQCDATVYLPMQGRKASMNVASAFAIAAYSISIHAK